MPSQIFSEIATTITYTTPEFLSVQITVTTVLYFTYYIYTLFYYSYNQFLCETI